MKQEATRFAKRAVDVEPFLVMDVEQQVPGVSNATWGGGQERQERGTGGEPSVQLARIWPRRMLR